MSFCKLTCALQCHTQVCHNHFAPRIQSPYWKKLKFFQKQPSLRPSARRPGKTVLTLRKLRRPRQSSMLSIKLICGGFMDSLGTKSFEEGCKASGGGKGRSIVRFWCSSKATSREGSRKGKGTISWGARGRGRGNQATQDQDQQKQRKQL